MSQLIDLMPENCRRKLGQRSEVRKWSAAYVALIAVVAVYTSLLTVMERSRLGEVRALRSQVQLDAGQRELAAALEKQIEQLEAGMRRHDLLAWPVRMGDVVTALGQATPDSVSLTSLNVTPRQERVAGRTRGAETDERPEAGRRMVIEIKGHAPDDMHVASFVAGLEGHPLFRRIAVDYTRQTELRGNSAREFGLSCEIDASQRYTFVDLSAEGELR